MDKMISPAKVMLNEFQYGVLGPEEYDLDLEALNRRVAFEEMLIKFCEEKGQVRELTFKKDRYINSNVHFVYELFLLLEQNKHLKNQFVQWCKKNFQNPDHHGFLNFIRFVRSEEVSKIVVIVNTLKGALTVENELIARVCIACGMTQTEATA